MTGTGFAETAAAFADLLIKRADAMGPHDVPGAKPDEAGFTPRAWLDHYHQQLRDMLAMAAKGITSREPMEKMLRDLSEGEPDALAKSDDPAVRATTQALAKARSAQREMAKAFADDVPVFRALEKRITEYLEMPTPRFGEIGTPAHLIGRALTFTSRTMGSA